MKLERGEGRPVREGRRRRKSGDGVEQGWVGDKGLGFGLLEGPTHIFLITASPRCIQHVNSHWTLHALKQADETDRRHLLGMPTGGGLKLMRHVSDPRHPRSLHHMPSMPSLSKTKTISSIYIY